MGDGLGKAWILAFRCKEEPPPCVVTETVVFLVCNGRMVHCSICYCPYRKGGRVLKSILQSKNHPELNFTSRILPPTCCGSPRVGYGPIQLLAVVVLAGIELQWSFYGKIVVVLWIQHRGTDREYKFQDKLIAPTSHLAPFRMTYNFSGA